MTTIQQYPDGAVYIGIGFLLGLVVGVLLTTRCTDHGKHAAVRPVPDTEQAENVTTLHAVGRGERRESKAS